MMAKRIPNMKNRMLVSMLAGSALAATTLAADVTPLFVLETAPMTEFAPSPLDAGMVRAIQMLPLRVDELPGEIPGFDRSYAQLINTMLHTIAKPMRVAVVHDSDSADGPTMGYGAVFSMNMGDEASAKALHEQVLGAMAESGAPDFEVLSNGMSLMETPGGPPIMFGPNRDGGAWRYEARLGYSGTAAGLMPKVDAAHGGKQVAQISVDLRALTPMLNLAKREASNQGEDLPLKVLGELEHMGLAGDNAMRVNVGMSYQGGGSLTTARVENLGGMWSTLGLPDGAIDPAIYNLVPADAWSAKFSRFDLEMITTLMAKLDEYGVPASEHVDQIGQTIGIDLVHDLVEPLGGHAVMYTSESTGGGGLASTVMLLQVRDSAKMLETNQKLIDLTNMMTMMVPYAGRYIRIAPWEHDGMQLFSLRFPGTPVPLEFTFAYEGDWAVFAVTPQGAVTAVNQIRGKGDKGLGSVALFRESIPGDRELFSASFVNAPRMFHKGYGTVAMIGSGLANLSRSPWDRNRDPGMIVPTYGELYAATRPIASWSYWDGDALEIRSTGSGSILANMVVTAGKSSGLGSMIGAFSSIAPTVAQQQGGFGMLTPPALPGVIDSWMSPIELAAAALVQIPESTLASPEAESPE